MENILIIDTETTGLDPSKGNVIEIAGIFYNIPTRSILSQVSTLYRADENPAYEINRIEVKALQSISESMNRYSETLLVNMMYECDAIVAHNAEFDKKWIETIINFQQISRDKKWICTKNDVIWPIRKGIPLNLIHICADLGVPIVHTHRALDDCLLLLSAIESVDDIDHLLDKSGRGRMIYHAHVGYDQRQIVKDAGFQWDNVKKVWFAKM